LNEKQRKGSRTRKVNDEFIEIVLDLSEQGMGIETIGKT
jgi:hypothetical protein